MARRITVEFLGEDKTLGKTTRDVEGKFGKLGGRMQRAGNIAGKALAGGLAAGGVAMFKLGQQAGDLAETQSKVNQIFGDEGAESLDEFASGAAKALGQSKQTALDAASTFGVFGKSAGLAGKDLVGFSTEMTTLATDMASFNNTSPEEAIEAVGAALRGESEPIRKYGVLLDDATLRTEAMRLGLIKTTKEALTPQQKVLAAQAAILKQTSDQQGDFARTSDGLANRQKILKAELENLGTSIGTKAVPAMQKMAAIATELVGWIDRNRTTVSIFAGVVVGLTATVWAVGAAMRVWAAATALWSGVTKVATAVQWAMNAALTANPIGLVIVALVGLGVALVIAYKKSETFRRIVNGAFDKVKAGIRALGAVGTWLWNSVFQPVFRFIVKGVAGVLSMWAKMLRGLSKVPGFGWAKRAADAMQNAANKANGIADGIRKIPTRKDVKVNVTTTYRQVGRATVPGTDIRTNVPQYARGTNFHPGGLAFVHADELIELPRGAKVHTAAATRGMIGSPQGIDSDRPIVVENRIYLDGKELHQSLVRRKRVVGSLGLE